MKLNNILKLRFKLRLPVIFQIILLAAFVYFYFSVNALLKEESSDKVLVSQLGQKVRTMYWGLNEYLTGKITHEQLDAKYVEILKLVNETDAITDEAKLKELKGLDAEINKIDTILKENLDIEKQIDQLTTLSIQQSNDFISGVSRKLLDKKLRSTVSDIERSIIESAKLNTNANYQIKVLFRDVKVDPKKEQELIGLLEQIIKNAELAVKSLAGTPYADLPKKAGEANIKIKELVIKCVNNLKSVEKSKDTIINTYEGVFVYFNQTEEDRRSETDKIFRDTFYVLFFVFAAVTLFIIILGYTLTRSILKPLDGMIDRARELAEGEVDMTRRLDIYSNDEMGELSSWFNKFLERLNQLIMKVKNSSDEVTHAADEIVDGGSNLAARTNEQAASITETSATMEHFTNTVRQNTEYSVEADMMLTEFNTEIQQKGSLIQNVTSTMTEIYDSSKEIDNIIKVINDISFQTNLLALNAAVEAARAGEAGRGFAVVASEVRNLAQKTAESSKSIQEIVLRNVESTQKGMELVKDTSEFFTEIISVMGDIVKKIANITSVSRGQSAGIEQINLAIEQMEKLSTHNAQMVEQFTSIGKKVKSNSAELQELVGHFNTADTTAAPSGKKERKPTAKKEPLKKEPPKKEIKKEDSKKKKEEKKPEPSKPEPEKKDQNKKCGPPSDNKPKSSPSQPVDDFFADTDTEGFEEF